MMALLWLACGGPPGTSGSVEAVAEPIGLAECAVCGMVVGEQPAPRGQVVYRDGAHEHVCSIEELRALVEHPAARGRPVGLFVEVLPADFDPTSPPSSAPLPWRPVSEVTFVFGAERPGVMGTPVLSFSDPEPAARVAATLGTRPVPWTDLAETPFNSVPASVER